MYVNEKTDDFIQHCSWARSSEWIVKEKLLQMQLNRMEDFI